LLVGISGVLGRFLRFDYRHGAAGPVWRRKIIENQSGDDGVTGNLPLNPRGENGITGGTGRFSVAAKPA
jgi:hypothetical protein